MYKNNHWVGLKRNDASNWLVIDAAVLCNGDVYKMKHAMFRNVQSSSARLFAKIDGEIFMWQRVKIFIYKNEGLLECM